MCSRFSLTLCSLVAAAFCGSIAGADVPEPNVLWWQFDEASGEIVEDSSGNGREGLISGAVRRAGGVGGAGGCLEFLGSGQTVEDDSAADYLNGLEGITVALWIKSDAVGTDSGFIWFSVPSGGDTGGIRYDAASWNWEGGTNLIKATVPGAGALEGSDRKQTTQWQHVAVVWSSGEEIKLYVDGVLDTPRGVDDPSAGPISGVTTLLVGKGAKDENADESWDGLIDDVRIYDYALTADQLHELATTNLPMFLKAFAPNPADGAEGVTSPAFTWTKGDTAMFHNVYFGTDPENLPQVAASQTFELYFHTGPLVPGTAYYWRVDEVTSAGEVITGELWSFLVTPLKAWAPAPANESEGVLPKLTLAWSPGQNAMAHHLYFGDDADAVAAGDPATDRGALDRDVVSYRVTEELKIGTTYYWRVDETVLDGTVQTGELWSFTVIEGGPGGVIYQWWTGVTGADLDTLRNNAHFPANPSGQVVLDIMEGPVDWDDNYGSRLIGYLYPSQTGDYTFWIACDDTGELLLSTDADPANAVAIASVPGWADSREWGKYPEQMSAPQSLVAGERYYIEAVMNEGIGGDNLAVAWQGPGIPMREVITGDHVGVTPHLPVRAYRPSPADDAVDTIQTPILTWLAGEKALQHDVYLGTDEEAVANADPTTADIYRGRQSGTTYNPGSLEWGKAYYWRVDEINTGDPESPWKGKVWTFTTADFIWVDDFETYTNEVGNRVFQTWIDGLGFSEPEPGNPGNGSAAYVGHDIWTAGTPYTQIVETGIVQSGDQSMPLYVNNSQSPYYSETDRTFAPAVDWTAGGVTDLSIWVHGQSDNTPDQLYVGLSSGGSPAVINADPDVVPSNEWVEVKIPLADFVGVNLGSIRQMIIGVGNRAAPVAGGDSLVFIDNIRVVKPDVASP